jgi:hypothetical protein
MHKIQKSAGQSTDQLTDLLTRRAGTEETTWDTGDAQRGLRLVSETRQNARDGGDMRRSASTADKYREVVELIATGRCSGLADQGNGHAVIGVNATAVLVKDVTEGRRELYDHERNVVVAAGAVPGPGARPFSHTISSALRSNEDT